MEEILEFLKSKMVIEEVTGSLIITKVTGRLCSPIDKTITEIKEYFAPTDYTPLFDTEGKNHVVKFGVFRKVKDKQKYALNIVLFTATLLSTIFVGAYNAGGDPFKNLSDIFLGIPFSLSIMAILTCHELGHYFVSRKAGMITSLPYFIPAPFHFFGTFGAVIRMKSIVPSRRTLLRVGVAGPIAGFVVALPLVAIGLALSEIGPVPEGLEYYTLGDSLLFSLLAKLLHPEIPSGYDLFLHPVALAGWIGFLVTSINLIPVGQLDGGHISYSLLLKKRKYTYIPILAILIGLCLLWKGWIVWIVLAFFLARRDPNVQDCITPLTIKEKLLAVIALIILIATFIPIPITLP